MVLLMMMTMMVIPGMAKAMTSRAKAG